MNRWNYLISIESFTVAFPRHLMMKLIALASCSRDLLAGSVWENYLEEEEIGILI